MKRELKRPKILLGLLVTLALILSMFGTEVPVYAFDVAITKSVTPTTPNTYRLGDTIHYTMSIINFSDVTQTYEDVVIEAVWDVLPDSSTVYPTGPSLPYILTPGASQPYTYDWVATITGTVINTFYANGYQISTGGNDYFNLSVQKSSQVIDPAIHIEKSTNGQDADSPIGPYITVGGLVTWEYVITNTGDSPLSNITVTESEAGVTPVYVSGDDGDAILQTTETWIYQASGTAVAGQYANTGYVTGTPPVGPDVSDEDPSHYFGYAPTPDIDIEKSTNGQDADSPIGPYITVGGLVTWEYVITNPGDVPLSNVKVIDNNGTQGFPGDNWHPTYISGDDGDNILQTTETWIYQANGTALAGQYANNSRATGTPPVGPDVSDEDPSHYFGCAPTFPDHIGFYRPGQGKFVLDMDGDGLWNAAVDRKTKFGAPDNTPIIGDWNGDGKDEIGFYQPSKGKFVLDMDGDGVWDAAVDRKTYFGKPDNTPIIGDWNGDGKDEIGFYRPSEGKFVLDMDGDGLWDAAVDRKTYFGAPNNTPIIGCW